MEIIRLQVLTMDDVCWEIC